MKRLAIFTEGLTEQAFLEKLLLEIAGNNNIVIEKQEATVSKKGNRSFRTIQAASSVSSQKYYILICDSHGEASVQSDVIDSYGSLAAKGYEMILGLRDVYPKRHEEIPRLEQALKYKVPTTPVPARIFLAVMEIEAWFLAETAHFQGLSPLLTCEHIKTQLSLDLCNMDVETRHNPADDLDRIYHLSGFAYTKRAKNIQRTVNLLDYSAIYLNLRNRIPRLDDFLLCIDSFFS